MRSPTHEQFRFFDPEGDLVVIERRLPHWQQAGTLCFLTWRTWDSIPEAVLSVWVKDRSAWLSKRGIDPFAPGCRDAIGRLSKQERAEFYQLFSNRWQALLDNCHGECVLRRPELAEVVAASLHHFNGDRYLLTDFVIMPNHVHVLVAFPTEQKMLDQCESWKHFTAVRLNKLLARTGRFWQVDGFDHLVRSDAQFSYLRRYIADNPEQARLRPDEFIRYSRELE